MKEETDIYRQLQQHLDRLPVGFPRTESGIEIRILKQMFTPEEAELAVELSAFPETIDRIYKRMRRKGITREELAKRLEAMEKRGLLLGPSFFYKEKGKKYSNALFVLGIWESQVYRASRKLFQDVIAYGEEKFGHEYFKKGTPPQMRIIPVGTSVAQENCVASYDSVRDIIRNTDDSIAVMNCICRQGHDTLGEHCKKTDLRETCMTFYSSARHYVTAGIARYITKTEALAIVDDLEKAGLVMQPTNDREPIGMCACCPCCCELLKYAKALPDPANYYRSNYHAVVDGAVCTGCATCVDRCPMDAVTVPDGISLVNLDRCLGCGLCTATCTTGAMTLRRKEQVTVPAKNNPALYQDIMVKKVGLPGALKMVAKSLAGRKV